MVSCRVLHAVRAADRATAGGGGGGSALSHGTPAKQPAPTPSTILSPHLLHAASRCRPGYEGKSVTTNFFFFFFPTIVRKCVACTTGTWSPGGPTATAACQPVTCPAATECRTGTSTVDPTTGLCTPLDSEDEGSVCSIGSCDGDGTCVGECRPVACAAQTLLAMTGHLWWCGFHDAPP